MALRDEAFRGVRGGHHRLPCPNSARWLWWMVRSLFALTSPFMAVSQLGPTLCPG
jgi:hypothetical protein